MHLSECKNELKYILLMEAGYMHRKHCAERQHTGVSAPKRPHKGRDSKLHKTKHTKYSGYNICCQLDLCRYAKAPAEKEFI
jgi:hypothetical protein